MFHCHQPHQLKRKNEAIKRNIFLLRRGTADLLDRNQALDIPAHLQKIIQMKLDKNQITTSLQSSRNIDGVKLDEDMNLQERKKLLNDFRLRVDRLITQKNY